MFTTNFRALDGWLVAIYLVAIVWIGLRAHRRRSTPADYAVAGRRVGASLNAASYVGTCLGLVTLMYSAIDAFENGLSFLLLPVMSGLVTLYLGATGAVVSPLRRLKLSTIPEYFERRFDRRTRILAGSMAAIAGILNMALFPRMGATFLTYVAGIGGEDANTLVNAITTILVALAVLYTVTGGMMAVIATDYVQYVVLSVGVLVALCSALLRPGLGWSEIGSTLTAHSGAAAVDPLANANYGWPWVVFHLFFFLLVAISWPPELSRSLTARDEAASRLTFLAAAPGLFVRLAIPAVLAVAAFTYFAAHAEAQAYFFPAGVSQPTANRAVALPLFLGHVVPSGLLGVLVAGLLAAFMSTHDSYLLAWATIATRDVVAPLVRTPLTSAQQTRLTKLMVTLIGLFLIVWGIWYPFPESVWSYMAATATVYVSGAGTVLLAGMYWPSASNLGARLGLVGGLFSLAALAPSSLRAQFGAWGSSSAVGLATIALCTTVVVVGSLLCPNRKTVEAAP